MALHHDAQDTLFWVKAEVVSPVQPLQRIDDRRGVSAIELLPNGIRVRNLVMPGKNIADYLRQRAECDPESCLTEVIEVGVFCLERANAVRDFDFVRSQVDSLVDEVARQVAGISQTVENSLGERLRSDDGQVLAPIKNLVDNTVKVMTDRVNGVKDLLVNDIDPTRTTSTLGQALGQLKELVDPGRKDSIQSRLADAVTTISGEDGVLAKSVKITVADAIRPLADEVNRMSRQLAAAEAAEDIIASTTRKGAPYEEEALTTVQTRVQATGAAVSYVGPDNRPGDIVIDFDQASIGSGLVVVVEARDRTSPLGRKAIADTANKAMAERKANFAIYVSRTHDGLASEIGDWAEGVSDRGRWIATTHEHLLVAVRFALVLYQLDRMDSERESVDTSAIAAQIERIRSALKRVSTIKTRVTAIRDSAGGIYEEAESLQTDVRSALLSIEESLRYADRARSGGA